MVRTLPSLQHLALRTQSLGMHPGGFPIGITTICPHLRHPEIWGAALGDLPPELGRLTGLTHLDLGCARTTSLPDSASRLSALQERNHASSSELSLPPGLTACRQLSQLRVERCPLPAVLTRLQSLRCLGFKAEADQLPDACCWNQLMGLMELRLLCWHGMPAMLGDFAGLQTLIITGARLDNLPAGPYLSRLESLEMAYCTVLDDFPASLAAAAQLRNLDIDHERAVSCVSLNAADMALLGSLPVLEP